MQTKKEKVYLVGDAAWHNQPREDKIQSVRDGIWNMYQQVREHKGKTLRTFGVEQMLFELGCYANSITKKKASDES